LGTTIGSQGRRAAFALAVAMCAAGIGASTAQAATPLTWAAPILSDTTPGTAGITALSCQSLSLCVAVDDAGNVLSSTAPAGGTWGAVTPIDSPATPNLTAISCPSATLCFAVAKAGANNLFASATPTISPWTPAAIDTGRQLNGISCPSTTLCVAVDNFGNVLTSTTPGTPASWSAPLSIDPAHPHITAVSCPTASLCAAVDDAGNVLLSSTPTTAWQLPTSLTSSRLNAVSCTAAGLCVAVANDGSVHATANATATAVTWSATPIDTAGAPLTAVSCTDIGLCVLVDHSGNALESDNPAAGPPTWTTTPIDQLHALTGVSCLSAGFCVAVDVFGDTMAAVLPAPAVTTGAGTASTQTTASLAATVNPNDATLSDCHFDYGPTITYGSSAPCTVVPNATGGSQSVVATLSGLNASTTYHFRIAASSGVLTGDGTDATFTTSAPLKPNPSISGTPAVGSTLTCKSNVTTTATETTAYQWLSDTQPIAGATAATYVIVATDQTHHLSCQVTIAGDGGSASATSGFDGVPSQTQGKINETIVGTDSHGATSASAPVTCSPQATGSCTIKLLLTVKQTVHGKKQTVTVGSSTTKLKPGASRKLSVSLNATGRSLLKKQHKLAATLTVSGTLLGRLTATLQTDKFTFKAAAPKHATRRTR
jgi:hypothetical protein